MYLTRYDRWSSPLYVIGESYGTTRAAGLAGHLVDKGIAFNGVILVSCALDFQGIFFSADNDLPYLNYLPSYAASAWYHKKLPADLQQLGLPALLKEVEGWVDREYVIDPVARRPALRRRAAAGRAAAGAIHRAEGRRHRRARPADRRWTTSTASCSVPSIDRSAGSTRGTRGSRTGRRPTPAAPSLDPSYAAVLAPYTTHLQPLHPRRAGLQERHAVPHPRRRRRPLGLPDRDGLPGDDVAAPRRHDPEPAHAGPDRLGLLRPGHALSRRRACPGRPGARPDRCARTSRPNTTRPGT